MAFLVPKLFVATHWYKPLSTGRKFLIVRLPSLTSVFPAGKGITSLIQVNLGGGYPSAWQVSCIWANSIFETSDEGFLVKIGRPNRRRINTMRLEKAIVFSGLPNYTQKLAAMWAMWVLLSSVKATLLVLLGYLNWRFWNHPVCLVRNFKIFIVYRM